MNLLIQLGNILRGATDTKRAKTSASLLSSAPVVVKTPTFIDVSHYDPPTDWSLIPSSVILLGTKATEGTAYKDPTFPDIFTKSKTLLGAHRLAYHFFRRAYDPIRQANWFIDYVEPYLDDTDILCLDFEEGGETANQLYDFVNQVAQRRPSNLLMIYSRKNLMEAVIMTASQKAYFKTIPSWVAGYPYDPNSYNTTPTAYIPDPLKWGKVWAWQYSDAGSVPGFNSAIDLNLMEQPLIDYVNGSPIPQPNTDVVITPYDGITQSRGERYDCKIYANVIDPQKVKIQVRDEYSKPSDLCKKYNAQVAWNGANWDRQSGEVDKNAYGLSVYANNNVAIGSNYNGYIYHSSIVRPLLVDGLIVVPESSADPTYYETHARSGVGVAADGKLIHVTVDGDYYYKGVTLWQLAAILREFGAIDGGDQGGGGDSVEVLDGVIQNVPDDEIGGVHYERKVPQSILIYSDGGSMARYEARAIGDNTKTRPNHNTVTDFNPARYFDANTLFEGELVWIADATNKDPSQYIGDKWLSVDKINGAAVSPCWVAVIHRGLPYCTLKENVTTPPVEPPAGDITANIVLKADGTVTGTWTEN